MSKGSTTGPEPRSKPCAGAKAPAELGTDKAELARDSSELLVKGGREWIREGEREGERG